MIIVDNYSKSFLFHPENGLPIKSWMGEKNDKQLLEFIPILKGLAVVADVWHFIPKFVFDSSTTIIRKAY